MDSGTAALIGAGVGSSVALASQLLNHSLSAQRDRRNQRRERLTRVIVEAAENLYKPAEDERLSREEFEAQERHPESLAAQDPDLFRDLEPLTKRASEGITLLQIHFGHEHPLVEKYSEVCATCYDAEEIWSRHLRSPEDAARLERIPEVMKALRAAQIARDEWMREAREEVERI
jgi:hypothetical protein